MGADSLFPVIKEQVCPATQIKTLFQRHPGLFPPPDICISGRSSDKLPPVRPMVKLVRPDRQHKAASGLPYRTANTLYTYRKLSGKFQIIKIGQGGVTVKTGICHGIKVIGTSIENAVITKH